MKVELMKWITRKILQSNPQKVFLFGDNVERIGMGGQAKEMRGERNAVGIATKYSPTYQRSAFFYDDDDPNPVSYINRDIDRAIDLALEIGIGTTHGPTIVIPADGLGTGLARLNETAPKTFQYLQRRLKELETK